MTDDVPTETVPCPYCSDGTITETQLVHDGTLGDEVTGADLETVETECPSCGGTGTVELPDEDELESETD